MADGDNVQPIRPGVVPSASRTAVIRAAQANVTLSAMHCVRWSEAMIQKPDDGVSEIMALHAIRDAVEAIGELQRALAPPAPPAPHTRSMLEASLAAITDQPPKGAA